MQCTHPPLNREKPEKQRYRSVDICNDTDSSSFPLHPITNERFEINLYYYINHIAFVKWKLVNNQF